MMFLRCVGEAIVARGLRGLMGLIPYGELIYEVADDAVGRYRRAKREAQIAADLEAVVRADAAEVRAAVHQIAEEVAAGRPPEEVRQVEAYLAQVPGVARQSLRRPQDPTGTTVPHAMNLNDPIQLANVLPRRAPRFHLGDAMPHAPQWRFVELLGAGGFGEVWLVRHSFLDQRRAVKFCLDAASRERLLRHEGEVVKRVMVESAGMKDGEHGIVPLVDAYLDGDAPWLAYEYVEGGDLAGVVRELHPAAPAERAARALGVLRDLAGVVGRFHRLPRPIVHRDLKPANVLVTNGRLRVTDFGISHVAADRSIGRAAVSTPSMNLGETFRGAHTPVYASPQQKRGMPADVRDDVYALGIIGYQLLLADLGAERPAGKWRKRVAACGLGDGVLDLLESCWDDDLDERPRDARALAEALDAVGLGKKERVEEPVRKPSATSTEHRIGEVITNALGMKFAWVPPGKSWLRGTERRPGTQEFTLTNGLWCGVYPVTQAEWEQVMGNNPSHFAGNPRYPVEQVSWYDVQKFLEKLTAGLRYDGLTYRLPDDDEWEYICRGGPLSSPQQSAYDFYFARSKADLTPAPTNYLSSTQANFNGNEPAGIAKKGPFLQRTSEVGSYLPNPLGIYDLHGNVGEWTTSAKGSAQVSRGGSWKLRGEFAAAINRWGFDPSCRNADMGFRLLAVPSG